jgi:hypothetical protein
VSAVSVVSAGCPAPSRFDDSDHNKNSTKQVNQNLNTTFGPCAHNTVSVNNTDCRCPWCLSCPWCPVSHSTTILTEQKFNKLKSTRIPTVGTFGPCAHNTVSVKNLRIPTVGTFGVRGWCSCLGVRGVFRVRSVGGTGVRVVSRSIVCQQEILLDTALRSTPTPT